LALEKRVFYKWLFFLGMIFRNTLSEIQNRIIFPLASAYQEDGEKLKELYVTSVNIALFIYLPSGFGIGFISADLVTVLFDDEWFEVGQLLPILAVAGVFGSLTRTIEQLYKGSGAAKEIFVFCLVSLCFLAYFAYFITDLSLLGVCQSILAASIAHFLIITIHSWYKFGIGMREFNITAPLIVSAAITMILVLAFVDNLDLVVGYRALFAKIVIGAITFSAVIFVLFWWFNRSMLERTLIYFRINPEQGQ
jgi:O-antigen/teichoic acid export membrane protein